MKGRKEIENFGQTKEVMLDGAELEYVFVVESTLSLIKTFCGR